MAILRPGRYNLQKDTKNGVVVDALTTVARRRRRPRDRHVTLVEGPSRKENAPVVDDTARSRAATRGPALPRRRCARIRELGAPKGTKTAEGFLFPATYELKASAPRQRLVEQQLDAFEENFKKSTCASPSARTSRATTC